MEDSILRHCKMCVCVCIYVYIYIYIYIYTYIYALHKNYKVFSNVTYGQVWLGT